MPRLSYMTVSLCILAALLSALALWENATGGLSSSPLAELLVPSLREAREQRMKLSAAVAAEMARRRQIDQVVLATAAERLSLLEGAGRLRELYRDEPECLWVMVCRRFPNVSDEERYCRLLIGEVVSFLTECDPKQALPAGRRLEAELGEHLRRGTLRLPEATPPLGVRSITVPPAPGKEAPR
jgi:hypothetical protein